MKKSLSFNPILLAVSALLMTSSGFAATASAPSHSQVTLSADCPWGAPRLEDVANEFLGVGTVESDGAYMINEIDKVVVQPGEDWKTSVQNSLGIFGKGKISELTTGDWEISYVLGRATEELGVSNAAFKEFQNTIKCAGSDSDRALFWGEYKTSANDYDWQGIYVAVLEKSSNRMLVIGSGVAQ